MASIWIVELTVECDSPDTRDSFLKSVRYVAEEFDDIVIKRENFKVRHTHCVKCGIPRHMGTLGTGVGHAPANQCRSAYWSGCERRRAELEKQNAVPSS
jgi:hypothetical protein